jgi:hypothetical protein
VRRAAALAASGHEVSCIVVLVAAHRFILCLDGRQRVSNFATLASDRGIYRCCRGKLRCDSCARRGRH